MISHLIRAGDAVKDLKGIKFLEMTDAIWMNYERIRNTVLSETDFRSHVFSLESQGLRKYEESMTDFFDHSFLVTEIDRLYLLVEKSTTITS